VEEKYEGPRLEDEVTEEFMKDLMQWHKDQKKLHKKYAFRVCERVGDIFEGDEGGMLI